MIFSYLPRPYLQPANNIWMLLAAEPWCLWPQMSDVVFIHLPHKGKLGEGQGTEDLNAVSSRSHVLRSFFSNSPDVSANSGMP